MINMPTAPQISMVIQEQHLLGAILINPEAYYAMGCKLLPEHFEEPLHQRIYDRLSRDIESGKQPNPYTLKAQFDTDEALINIPGQNYLTNLAASCGLVDVRGIAEEIQQGYNRRCMVSLLQEKMAVLMAGGEIDAEQLGIDTASEIQALFSKGVSAKMQNDYEISERIMENLRQNIQPISTGLKKLDNAMGGGLYPAKVYGFAARMKIGKTILAGTISHNLAQQGVKHLFICGEMSPEEIHQRTLARQTDSFESSFRSDYANNPDFQKRLAKVITESKRCTIYNNAPGLTLSDLHHSVSVAVLKYKIKGFILDYWQLVGGKQKGQSDASHLDKVAQDIADMCKKHKIFAIVMGQINQEGNTRGGEGMKLAFDQVYQIHRDDPSEPVTWVEMMATRYTKWGNIGGTDPRTKLFSPGWNLNEKGPFFEEV